MPQSCQCDGNLLLVATADSVRDDIHLVSSSKQVDGGLCNANVTLDANDYARKRAGRIEVIKSFLDFGCANAS